MRDWGDYRTDGSIIQVGVPLQQSQSLPRSVRTARTPPHQSRHPSLQPAGQQRLLVIECGVLQPLVQTAKNSDGNIQSSGDFNEIFSLANTNKVNYFWLLKKSIIA